MDALIKKILREQLELLAEASKACNDGSNLAQLTSQMVNLALCLSDRPSLSDFD